MTIADICNSNIADCCGCFSCKNICPSGAISFSFDKEGFWYPEVDQKKCIDCGKCVKSCPCVQKPKVLRVKNTIACAAKELQELMSSSSGGIFAVLAREVLKEGGYVCGAAFDENFAVVHKIIDLENQLKEIKGTKYVQSKIGSVYSEIKSLLKNGNKVLFSGTPCQVAGLKSFLDRDYDNLITIDLICHGVPSPRIWKEYLDEISENRVVKSVNFRNKQNGISNATIDIVFQNGESISENVADNPYYKGFLKNLYLRPSCFECKFKGLKRCSDITIGDFWAVKEYYPEFDSKYGTSAVILRSKKSKELYERIKCNVKTISVKKKELSMWNECLLKSTMFTESKTRFYYYKRDKGVINSINNLSV